MLAKYLWHSTTRSAFGQQFSIDQNVRKAARVMRASHRGCGPSTRLSQHSAISTRVCSRPRRRSHRSRNGSLVRRARREKFSPSIDSASDASCHTCTSALPRCKNASCEVSNSRPSRKFAREFAPPLDAVNVERLARAVLRTICSRVIPVFTLSKYIARWTCSKTR